MATGDATDMAARMAAVLPARWFPTLADAPVLNGVLTGLGQAWAFCYGLIGYARAQTRLATASGVFLDMIASDVGGVGLYRLANEPDDAFRGRIEATLLRDRGTRAALISAVSALTGAVVRVFEPMRPADTGGYAALAAPGIGGGGGYGSLALRYGSLAAPFQCFVDAARHVDGVPSFAVQPYAALASAVGTAAQGGYARGAVEYLTADVLGTAVTDTVIEAAIADVLPACATAWVRLA